MYANLQAPVTGSEPERPTLITAALETMAWAPAPLRTFNRQLKDPFRQMPPAGSHHPPALWRTPFRLLVPVIAY
ncbi:hypothetical protein B2K_38565 [Paenibacillus mucilaginosus K02]|uniref:Uncharacterized protein n=2 Tax=Paenibacillus mucilaginosus TaxID=61624 RepID=R9UPM5_9BACL|nr:hypothetical protein KNP414_03646 [Paenibacillus mucilaginosus KNP414]AGN70575.1 hypothetical protein B2K_38565 [Paenibacillus mucilaginosus K02]WFA16843.1 hypothetical protein ERY13_05550 [Paenibacillus mucilaginosus]